MKLEDIDLCDAGRFVNGVPHEELTFLRQHAPVFWHKEPQDGRGFWAITKYADVVSISRDPATFSSASGTNIFEVHGEDLGTIQSMLINMDPPGHGKYRRLVNRGLTPRMVAALEPHIRELTRGIVDRVATKGECDFVAEVAAELPLLVIAEFLGLPEDDRRKVYDWSNRLIGFDDPEFQQSMNDGKLAAMEVWAYASELAERRRREPGDDLVSVLLQGDIDGERLSEKDFTNFFLLLAVAGNETTRNLVAAGMLALIQHPEQRARLLADMSLLPSAVEEMLRWVTPVIHFRRTALRDTEVRGQKIAKGDKVVMFYPSANRDEEVFPEPFRFDVGRTPNDHLAFGIGEHFCMGANLARLEIRLMFEELLTRLPDMELAGPVERLRSNFIGGVKRMPVRFTPPR